VDRADYGFTGVEVPIEPIQPELFAAIHEILGRAYHGWNGRRESGGDRGARTIERRGGGTTNVVLRVLRVSVATFQLGCELFTMHRGGA
jgi:hypothetical protein